MNLIAMLAVHLTLGLCAAPRDPNPSEAATAFAAIQKDWNKAGADYEKAYDEAKTAADRKLLASKKPNVAQFAIRYVKLAEAYPGTKEELCSLCWAGLKDSQSDAGKKAIAKLTGGRIDRATPADLYKALDFAGNSRGERLAPAVLARAKKSLDDSQAARLLAWVCVAYRHDDSDRAPEPFTEAADLILAKFADEPGISHFCESLYLNGGPPWAASFEKHLRTISEKNKTPLVRVTSRFAVASVVRSKGVDAQGKAEELFRQFIADFAIKTEDDARSGVRKNLLDQARQELKEIQLCGLGKKAQAIDGKDLDGQPLKLSDHKGKVVLLVFWASWCKPCMEELPHEIKLMKRFQERPFALVGVNGDDELDAANDAVKKAGIPWRSIADGKRGNGRIAEAWAVAEWPTVYVIDHTGVIRESRRRGKRLDRPLEALITEAEKAVRP